MQNIMGQHCELVWYYAYILHDKMYCKLLYQLWRMYLDQDFVLYLLSGVENINWRQANDI